MSSGKHLNIDLSFNADTSRAQKEIQKLQASLDKVIQTSSNTSGGPKLNQQLHDASVAAAELKQHLKAAFNTETGTLDVGVLSNSLKQAGTSLEEYRIRLNKIGPEGRQAFNNIAQSVLNAEVPLKKTNTLLNQFATTLKNTARWQISSSILHGFMGSVQSAFYYAQDLNESLNNIRIVTGQSTDQMAKFAEEANKAAQALNTTTTEYTNASLIYYQQGLSDDEVKKRTDVTVKMANVTRQSAEEVSQQMTAIWNNFAKGGENLEYYSDVITALGAATASSSSEIAQGLEKFAATADTVGLSYEYATSALATVTATTRQSADIVGNAFKTLFARLEGLKLGDTLDDGTDLNKYSTALATVGVNIKDVNGEMKSMDSILDELGAKWQTLGKDQQVALAQTVGGVRQYTQLIALMDNWDFFQQNLGVAQGAEGALQDQADIYAESWEAASKRVKAALEEIYNQLLDDKFFIFLNNALADLLNIISKTIDGMGGLLGVLSAISIVINKMFGKEIVASLTNFFTTAEQRSQQWINAQRTALESLKQQSIADNTPQTVKAYESVLKVNEQLGQSVNNLGEKQRAIVSELYKGVKAHAETVKVMEKETAELIKQEKLAGEKLKNASENRKNAVNSRDTIKHKLNKNQKEAAENFSNSIIDKNLNKDINENSEAFKELTTAMNENKEKAKEVAQAYLNARIAIKQEEEAMDESNAAMELASESQVELDNMLDITEQKAQEAAREIQVLAQETLEEEMAAASAGDVILGFAQALSSLGMLIGMVSGLTDIWSDEDLSTGEKVLTTITTLATAVPVLSMAWSSAAQAGEAFSLLMTKQAMAAGSAAAAEAVASGTTLTLGASLKAAAVAAYEFWLSLGPIGWAIAAITAAIATYIAVSAQFSPEHKLKEASEAAKKAADNFEEVKNKYDELKNSLEDYNDSKTALDKLTTGTQEWNDAVSELNEKVLELMGNYPELAQYIKETNGVLEISEEGQQELLKAQQAEVNKASTAKIATKSNETRAQVAVDKQDVLKKTMLSEDTFDKAMKAFEESGTVIAKNTEEFAKLIDASENEKVVLENSRDALIDFYQSTQLAEKGIKNQQKIIGSALVQAAGREGLEGEQKERVASVAGKNYQTIFDAATAIGFSEEKVTQMAEETVIKSMDSYINAIEEANKSASKQVSKETANIIVDYLTQGAEEALNNATANRLDQINKYNYSELDEDTKTQLGVDEDTFKEWQESVSKNFEAETTKLRDNMTEKTREIFDGLANSGELDNMTLGSQKAIAQALDKAVVSGSNDAFKLIEDSLKDSSVDAENFAGIFNDINWNNESVYDFKKKLKEVGVDTNNLDVDLQQLILSMQDSSTALESLAETFAKINKIISGIQKGDTISAEDYATLGKYGEGYFSKMADGTYMLIGSAEEFKKKVQEGMANDASANVDRISNQIDQKENIKNTIDSDEFESLVNLEQSNASTEQIQKQIDLVKVLGDQSEETQKKVQLWQDALNSGDISADKYAEIKQELLGLTGAYHNLDESIIADKEALNQQKSVLESTYTSIDQLDTSLLNLKATYENGKVSKEELTAAEERYANSLEVVAKNEADAKGLDYSEVDAYAKSLSKMAKESDKISDSLENNRKAALEVSMANTRMNSGLSKLKSGMKEWKSELTKANKETPEYAKAMEEVKSAMEDVVNVDTGALSDDFIVDNLKDIEAAANGDAAAVERLRKAASEDILVQVTGATDFSSIDSDLQNLANTISDYAANNNLEIGASLDNSSFIDSCNEMIKAAGMTATQAADYFKALGYDADITTESSEYHQEVPVVRYEASGDLVKGDLKITPTVDTEIATLHQTVPVVKSMTYTGSAGGTINRSNKKSGGSGGGGGKKGSSSSKKEKKDNKSFEDEIDRYWDLNNAIKATNTALTQQEAKMKKLDSVESHLYGKALIDNLKQKNELIKEQTSLLDKQRTNYEALYTEQNKELGELKQKLASIGGTFDGNVFTNYSSILTKAINNYNAAVNKYNASGQTDADKQALETAEKQYTKIKETIDRYRALYYDEMADTQNQLDDITQKQLENHLKILENNLKGWEVGINLKLDATKAKRDINNFLKQVQQDFRKVYKDLRIDTKFDSANFKEYAQDVQTTAEAMANVQNEIQKLKSGLDSDLFASVEEGEEKLKELQEQLLSQGESLNSLYNDIWSNYLEGIDQTNDKLQDIISQYEKINDTLEYQKQLVELLYGDKAYDLMSKFYKEQAKNNTSQINALKQQVDFWQQEFNKSFNLNKDRVNMDDMSTWTEDMKKAYENMENAQSSLNDLIIKGVQILQDDYLNSVNQIIDEMEKGIWGMSLEDMKTNWDHIQKLSDEYLDNIQGAYKVQTLANKIDKEIAKTNDTRAQQKLQKLREDEISTLREKENLTQSDLDIAEARLQIALKEMALEDAQNSKNSMKLNRDTSGNWTYQYVADDQGVADKKQELLDAYNNLYEISNNAYNHAMELATSTYEEMEERIRAIGEDTTLTVEQKEQRIVEITDAYNEEIVAAAQNAELYRQEAMYATASVFSEVCEQDADAYLTLTDTQKELVDEVKDRHLEDYEEIRAAIIDGVYPDLASAAREAFEDTNYNSQTVAADVISTWAADNGESVTSVIISSVDSIVAKTKDYEVELNTLEKVAGVEFGKLDKEIEKTGAKTDELNDKTKKMCDDSSGYLDTLRSHVDDVAKSWDNVINQIQKAKTELSSYLNLQYGGTAGSSNKSSTSNAGTAAQTAASNGGQAAASGNAAAAKATGATGGYKVGDKITYKGIYYNDSFGSTASTGSILSGVKAGAQIDIVNGNAYGIHIRSADNSYPDLGWISPAQILQKFDTGGYTGDWDSSGRLGILHQKELVLNAEDTGNILQAVSAVRDLTNLNDSISASIAESISRIAFNMVNGGAGGINKNSNSNTENQFYITAEFPNANDVESIREAILSLPNLASQHIHK